MRYRVIFQKDAKRDLEALPAHVQRRVLRWLDLLAEDPRRAGTRQLEGCPGIRRVHAGKDYVVLYTVQEQDVVVLVLAVAHRRQVYRRL